MSIDVVKSAMSGVRSMQLCVHTVGMCLNGTQFFDFCGLNLNQFFFTNLGLAHKKNVVNAVSASTDHQISLV